MTHSAGQSIIEYLLLGGSVTILLLLLLGDPADPNPFNGPVRAKAVQVAERGLNQIHAIPSH